MFVNGFFKNYAEKVSPLTGLPGFLIFTDYTHTLMITHTLQRGGYRPKGGLTTVYSFRNMPSTGYRISKIA